MKLPRRFLASGLLAALFQATAATEPPDIPTEPPRDSLMASPAEVQAMADWAATSFGLPNTNRHQPIVRVELRRQDHSVLRFGQSCIETPLRIGDRSFQHGLGTHANSEIILRFPPSAKTFEASAGIDHNPDTGGQRGSVQFSVELAGRELFRSRTLTGRDAALPVRVDLPPGTTELVLKVHTTPDGPAHDQADWADARILLGDGTVAWADEDRIPFLACLTPFSFVCDGKASAAILPAWTRSAHSRQDPAGITHVIAWTDEHTGLRLEAAVRAFERYPAVEWLLQFANTGTQPSPILDHILPLDVQVRTGYARKPATLRQITGDVCGEQSFLPTQTPLEPGRPLALAPTGGRPSNHTFPFFDVEYGTDSLRVALGWSGQWAARIERSPAGPTRLQAGQEFTRLRLMPGESIRTPRILLMTAPADRDVLNNRFRRLLLFEYVPSLRRKPIRLPVASQCFDRYVGSQPEWSTEAGQIRAVEAARTLGCDTHWLDAAWFEGGFPNGVGNWFCKPAGFPNGLKPVSDACHRAGLDFLVWFEPERVAPRSRIALEHPEFVFGGTNGGLFKLNEPTARKWLADLLSQRIREFDLDAYRNDFNIDPLPYWRAADAPDRQGITEIRYVQGHYLLWDDLRARRPGLWIDNCASGGRRIDLETLMRSVPLWRSDTGCSPNHADWDQTQTLGLAPYIPLFTSCAWEPKPYVLRSSAAAGVITQFDYLNPQFSAEQARAALAEVIDNRKFWYGDFYPLTQAAAGPETFAAWQLHRPDLHAGIVLAFRRARCPFPILETSLRGLDPNANYRLELIDEDRQQRVAQMTGLQLADRLELRIPTRASSLLVRYAQTPAADRPQTAR